MEDYFQRKQLREMHGQEEGDRQFWSLKRGMLAAQEQYGKEVVDILGGMVGKVGELAKEGLVATAVGITYLIGGASPGGAGREARAEIKEAVSEAGAELKDRVKTTARGITDVPAAFAELAPEAYEVLLDLAATESGRRTVGGIYTEAAAPIVAAGAAAESLPALARTARDAFRKARRFLDEAFESGSRVGPRGTSPSSAGTGNPWAKGPGPRGLAIEDAVEASGLRSGRLPKGFRGVDFHEGVVTSTKSVDLRLPSYQDPVRLQRTLQGYVDKLEAFQGGALKGKVIRPSDIAGRQLDVAIPPGPLSASQRLAIETAQGYGSARGIRVNVFVVE